MARAAKTTTDHDEIRQWAEKNGGQPAAVKGTGRGGDPGILRIDFPGYSGARSLEPISWDEFFQWFDENELALLYRGDDRFNKLISRSTAHAKGRGGRASASKANGRPAKTTGRSAAKRAGGKRGAAKRAPTKRTAKRTEAKTQRRPKKAPPKRTAPKRAGNGQSQQGRRAAAGR